MEKTNWRWIAICNILVLVLASVAEGGRQSSALRGLMKVKRSGAVYRGAWDISLGTSLILESLERIDSHIRIIEQQGMKEKDKIRRLPGQPKIDFEHYSGYVTVNEEAGRALFYYLAESVGRNTQSRPLLLWLNGGPGCSSLGYGAFQELGPFRVGSDGKTLFRNRYAWNEVANVLFLESPAGTGFSYSNRSSDYSTVGDRRMTLDSYIFLLNWLQRFPEYKNRDFYIAGESYAGHSVTELAVTILQHNRSPKVGTKINLKGITIGNAVIDDETDEQGTYDFYWTHSLSSDESMKAIHKYCLAPNTTQNFYKCDLARTDADLTAGEVDLYNIYAPLCKSHELTDRPKRINFEHLDPCTEYYTDYYLNLPHVQKALHANLTGLSFPWAGCSDVLNTTWKDSPHSILPLISELMDVGIRVWIYSGDVDGVRSVTSTRYSLKKLQLPIKTIWYPWYSYNEVGGFTFEYEGDLTFATVRGAGHEVPSYQPARALTYISHFLQGLPLPSS